MTTTRKHMTLRNLERDLIIEEGMTMTVDRALDRWRAMPQVVAVRLVMATAAFRSDGECFLTVIADVDREQP